MPNDVDIFPVTVEIEAPAEAPVELIDDRTAADADFGTVLRKMDAANVITFERIPAPVELPEGLSPWSDGAKCLQKLNEELDRGPQSWLWKAFDALATKYHYKQPLTRAEQILLEFFIPDKREQIGWLLRESGRVKGVMELQQAYRDADAACDFDSCERIAASLRRAAPSWAKPQRSDTLRDEAEMLVRKLSEKQNRRDTLHQIVEMHVEQAQLVDGEIAYVKQPPAMDNPMLVAFCSRLPADHPAYPGEYGGANGFTKKRVELEAFLALRGELRAELATLEVEITILEPDAIEARRKADESDEARASCYIPKPGR
jgi:hypothetical protein